MNEVRVLHVLGALNAGGMESMIMNYYRNIDEKRVIIDFLVFSEKSHYDDEAEQLGSKIHRLTSRRKNPLKHYKEVDQFFKNNTTYNIVHIHQGITSFSVLKACKKYDIRNVIVHSHGVDLNHRKKYKFLYKNYSVPLISKLSDYRFACSKTAANELYTKAIVDNNDYLLMHNAIDTKKFLFNEEIRIKKREALGLNEKFVIINIARFSYQKNHLFLIDIFNDIYTKNPNAILLLVGGEGDSAEAVRQKVKKLKLESVVKFLGVRKDANELLSAADVLVLPSLFEGLPVIGIEAQASGIKSFMSDAITEETKITELMEIISLNESSKYWAEKILKYKDGYERKNMYSEILKAGYDIKQNAKWLEEFYLSLNIL